MDLNGIKLRLESCLLAQFHLWREEQTPAYCSPSAPVSLRGLLNMQILNTTVF